MLRTSFITWNGQKMDSSGWTVHLYLRVHTELITTLEQSQIFQDLQKHNYHMRHKSIGKHVNSTLKTKDELARTSSWYSSNIAIKCRVKDLSLSQLILVAQKMLRNWARRVTLLAESAGTGDGVSSLMKEHSASMTWYQMWMSIGQLDVINTSKNWTLNPWGVSRCSMNDSCCKEGEGGAGNVKTNAPLSCVQSSVGMLEREMTKKTDLFRVTQQTERILSSHQR